MIPSDSITILVVLERRLVSHGWTDETWHVVGVLPDSDPTPLPRRLRADESGDQYLIGPASVALHSSDVSSYRYNLGTEQPRLFIALRREDTDTDTDAPVPWRVVLATAAPDEAQSLMEHGEDVVEAVPMPAEILAWVKDFADRGPPEENFHKRRRKEWRQDPPGT